MFSHRKVGAKKLRNQASYLIPELEYVEMGRIELPSDVVLPGLLRAQFATDFLCPNHHANMWLIRAQLPKYVPNSGNDRWIQWLSK